MEDHLSEVVEMSENSADGVANLSDIIRQHIFQFLKENLQVTMDSSGVGYDGNEVSVNISLRNPNTGNWEIIGSDYARIRQT